MPDVEKIRFSRETIFADDLAARIRTSGGTVPPKEHLTEDRVRRRLLSSHVKLSENMAPDVFQYAHAAASRLGIAKPIEIYQAAGEENAANWKCSDVVFISLQGGMMSLLDRGSFIALLGHEFGHHLAHTDSFGESGRQMASDFAVGIAGDPNAPMELRVVASRLAMAKEFTADRFAALAVGELDGALRLMMSVVTGLPAERLKGDCGSYLAQARALFAEGGDQELRSIGSHPEHLLRVYALSLFVQSDEFQRHSGTGIGSRSLAEIDAELERLLVGAKQQVFETGKDHALPPEIQEFALCSASILASADGSLDESESKALEETFSSVLPNWKELLRQDAALARFAELLPLAVAGGEPVAASVFHLLLHVMLVDREVHVRELELLSAIGRSLRQEAMFDYLLASVIRELKVARSDVPVDRPLPALPPGRHEMEAALSGLFAGISRRGGGAVPLARLLRIAGKPRWDDAIQTIIETAAAAHQLFLEAPPTDADGQGAGGDQRLHFRLTEDESARREQAASVEQAGELASAKTRDALVSALKHLRERLVSGDGRSPSVRLYRASTGRHFDLSLVDRVVDGRSERIVAMLHSSNVIPLLGGEEAGRDKAASDAARAVRLLDREFKARVEETGTRDMFVGYPFLVGVVEGFFVRAPLILHPFSLAGDGKGAGSYGLRRREDDQATANQALIRLLFSKKGFSFTEELAADLDAKASEGCESLLAALRQIGLDARPLTGSVVPLEEMNPTATSLLPEGLAVSENAVIGFFPQSSSDLLQDYDDLLSKLEKDGIEDLGPVLNAACDLLPSHYRPEFSTRAADDRPSQPIVYSDPSQRAAVLKSRAARLLVLDGPPGTGKSQTIVNLVADCLADGGRVAVICEKRVALDVVKQRMDSAGIGHLAAVVHDVYDDRKSLCRQIADRLENPQRRTFDATKLAAASEEAAVIEGQLAERAQLLATRVGERMSLGELHTLAAGLSGPGAAAPGLECVLEDDLPRLLKGVRDLHPFARFWSAGSIFRPPDPAQRRASFAQALPDDLEAILQNLVGVQESASAYAALYAAHQLPTDLLESAEMALKTVASFSSGISKPSQPDIISRMVAIRISGQDKVSHIEECFGLINKFRSAAEVEKERVDWAFIEDFSLSLEAASLRVGSFFRFLNPSWRRASATIHAGIVRNWPEKAGCKLDSDLLIALERRFLAAHAWTASETLFGELHILSRLPRKADQLFLLVEELCTAWEASARVAETRLTLDPLGLWPFQAADGLAIEWSAWAAECQSALDLLSAQRTYFAAFWKAADTFPQISQLTPDDLARLVSEFRSESHNLAAADRVISNLDALFSDATTLIQILADGLPEADATAWADSALLGWAEARIAFAESSLPGLASLDQPPPLGSCAEASKRLLELHQVIAFEESLKLAAESDCRGLMAVPVAAPRVRRSPEQTARENLVRECRKQRNVLPLRTLVRRTVPAGLLDVVPVWLMSPETTAILFPREPVFDLLVVDEASQCTVETGLPVLTRARRAVVAGDDKQMPPSSFFKATSAIEMETSESDAMPVDSFESESLLVLARQSGSGTSLRWHYRALFEELIAFSNHSMYGGSLLTIPATRSRSAEPALRWVRVEGGTWDAGCNAVEAKKVVDLLGELLSRPNPPTVGIITFNLQQRRTILDEIDARRSVDAEFSRVFDAAASAQHLDARPFVKNLESVQGDERDVILFSLGYAPTQRKKRDGSEETYVPARFGPLGQKGGERRLNVAVSRAKSEIMVVSSFDPSMLSVANTKHDGPRMFKAFVEFAKHLGEGRRNQAEKILSLVTDENLNRNNKALDRTHAGTTLALPLHHQVALALESAGLNVETQVGTSEFHLPIAVVHHADPHRYALAILCEDGTTETDIYESYVHVPNVLAHRKWKHIRVNAREWHRDRQNVIRQILENAAEST